VSLRWRLGEGARQVVQARFSAETNTRQLLGLIKHVVDEGAIRR
jgi:hypothetical protein